MLVTRIAPTPSGYLHEGNAVNFLLTAWLARSARGRLVLRIDDMDSGRKRPEYVADIFALLDWLDIQPDAGPGSVAEFEREYSMSLRTEEFRARLAAIGRNGGRTYACRCSRRELAGHSIYPGTCRSAGLELRAGETALRLQVPAGASARVAGSAVDVAGVMGDFVVWRRDDLPSYHLASVIEDDRLGVTHVVRGVDLRESTAAQRVLAPLVGSAGFAGADVRHHRLLLAPDGSKLAKSAGIRGSSMVGQPGLRDRIVEHARRLAPEVGIAPLG